ncbi:MAG: hypothetical protein K2X82_26175 [Gemmataceae bacterium]|nr:hypothetical protein [Gemmataceae bacterium]
MADRVKPVVRLFFPCDDAVIDLADGKWMLKNPWHTVGMPPGVREKFGQRLIWLYAQLTDGVGEFDLTVELRNYDTGERLGRSKPERWDFAGGDQLTVHEVVFKMENVPFPTPGLYVFQLMANHAELDGGAAYLRVYPG